MISIIIPSRDQKTLTEILDNIEKTVGVPFEIITYDNSRDGFGICKIYNLCAANAKYNYLVFCHDDIKFCTENWGQELIKLLDKEDIGIVGISGATYKSKYPAPWISIDKKFYRSNLLETNVNGFIETKNYDDVAVLDGCFLGMRKVVWQKYMFNEDQLSGFHLYDIDISIRVGKDFQIIVTNNIVIDHFSGGTFDNNWYLESKKYHIKNRNLFPVNTFGNVNSSHLNGQAIRSLIYRSPSLGITKFERIEFILKLLFISPRQFSINMLKVII